MKNLPLNQKRTVIAACTLLILVVFAAALGMSQQEAPQCISRNAEQPLLLKNAYGNYQATHPDVVAFEEPWNGYSFWMAFTPYCNADDKTENPHILVSNDMISWVEPENYTNPLEPEPEDYRRGVIYNSDADLVYNRDLDRLECWWRYYNKEADSVIIYRKVTTDGHSWSEKEILQTSPISRDDYVSPAVIYDDGIYKIWTIGNRYKLRFWESVTGADWELRWEQNIRYEDDNLRSWHVNMIHTLNGYEGVVVAFDSTIEKQSHQKMSLYYLHSENNRDYEKARCILSPKTGTDAWDNWGIYRSTLVYYNDNYYLFYAAIATDEERMVGLIFGSEVDSMSGTGDQAARGV